MRKVHLFVPNLIGYARIVLNLLAFYFMLRKPYVTVVLHFTGGFLLDVVDGITARHLDQCSKFGDLLDMLVDRCGRIGMLMGLCVLYPQHLFAFQLVACLEIAGCWSNHYRCALLSNQHQVFQKTRATDPWILKIFFQEPICSFAICGQDTCVAMCYLLHFSPGPTVTLAGSSHSLWRVLAWLGVPFFVYRQVLVCGLLILTSFGELARLHHQQSWTLNKNTSAFRDKRD
ncbi:CDP-diacylglycerol--inositol 3-phosphatidyltransferase-like isoform X1 [Montipora capricornis]|uniref:CDP-diacylglycerol--inositol 3-phosphatidyltransferase-like isoform X1 n=1 Tax=Montipora capricornis TaxID=246305 RepID=UPI0035F1ACE5